MKQYYGNYLGICINSNDPERRGRVQIFIPHIMPTLYESWNKDGNDHSFTGLGDNIQDGLPSEVIERLQKVLPWAEAASPVMGSSSPGVLTSIVDKVKHFFDLSPTQNNPDSTNGVKSTASISGDTPIAPIQSQPVPLSQDGTNNIKTDINKTNLINVIEAARGAGTLTTVVNATSKANDISVDVNGNPYSKLLEKKGGNPETSLKTNNGNNIDAMRIPYIAVENIKDIGKPFIIQIDKNAPVLAIGADSSTIRGNGDVLGTTAAAGINRYQGEISPAAMVAAGGKVTFKNGDLITELQPGSTLSITPLTDGSIPSFNSKTLTPEFLEQYYGSQLTAEQTASLQNIVTNAIKNTGENASAGQYSKGSLVHKTDSNGPTTSYNLNDTAKGIFSYPAPGATLWVFFQEGNPLFPVYFAANYGAAEWKSAYKYGSPGWAYTPTGDPDNPVTSTGIIMNFGAGIINSATTKDPTTINNNQETFYIGHDDGSNMLFNNGYHQIFSKFDRRDQVEKDRFTSTYGYEENWVQGDSNKVVMGDVYVKIGNITQSSVDATLRIQEIGKTIYQPLVDKNNINK
jgi:hypothetical protein